MMAKTAWTAKEKQFLEENKHKSCPELARLLNKTPQAIRMAKKRWGLTGIKPSLDNREEEFLAAYRLGFSDKLIAQRLMVNPETVRRWRLRLKLAANGWSPLTRKKQSQHRKNYSIRDRKGIEYNLQGRGKKPQSVRNKTAATIDRSYGREETVFILAMGKLKERLKRLPTYSEVLQEAKRLGYRKEENL